MNKKQNKHKQFVTCGQRGRSADIDVLMEALVTDPTLATAKLVDLSLSLVQTGEGLTRIKHYLFEGAPIQRKVAARTFWRRGDARLVQQAIDQGLIDDPASDTSKT